MMDMKEIKVYPQELELIPIERTSPIPADKPVEKITGRQYRKALKRAWLIVGVELGIIAVQMGIIWILQVGAI